MSSGCLYGSVGVSDVVLESVGVSDVVLESVGVSDVVLESVGVSNVVLESDSQCLGQWVCLVYVHSGWVQCSVNIMV